MARASACHAEGRGFESHHPLSLDLSEPYARARVWQDEPRRRLQRVFDEYFADGSLHRVLDAGAGYELSVDVPLHVHLTALDSSKPALEKNENAEEKIVGDLQTYRLPADHFDAIICWWVLEHLPCPRDAMANMARALRQGGLLIVAVPYLWGLKALVTKLTPYGFHVWLARRVNPLAGTPGVGPYPTYLRRDLSPRRLGRVAAALGLRPLYSEAYSAELPTLPPPLRPLWNGIGRVGRAVTLGRVDPLLSEYVIVFRKS